MGKFRHLVLELAGAVVLAAAVPTVGLAAQADTGLRPDDRAIHGPGAVAAGAPAATVRPDDRAFRGVGRVPAASPVRPDDRADRSLPTMAVEALPTTADGFDWTDAGVGAAGAFGLVLLVAAASVVGLRLRRAPAPS